MKTTLIEVYSFDLLTNKLVLKSLLSNFISFTWHRRFRAVGEFEITAPLNQQTLELLQINNYVVLNGQNEIGLIDYIEFAKDEVGTQTVVVKGRFATQLLSYRIAWSKYTGYNTTYNHLKNVYNYNTNTEQRALPVIGNIVDKASYPTKNTKFDFQVTYKNLLDSFSDLVCSADENIGYRAVKNNDLIDIEIYNGEYKQNVLFGDKFGNSYNELYTNTENDYKNWYLCGGKGEDVDRVLVSSGDSGAIGLARKELFIDAKSVEEPKIGETEEVDMPKYRELLQNEIKNKKEEFKKVETFESDVDYKGIYKYRVDFDLGDEVRFINQQWNRQLITRITEIKEVFEGINHSVELTFGNQVPTLIDILKRKEV